MLIRKYPDRKRFITLARDHNVVPVCVEILADMETPVSLLAKLYRNQGPIFLLESVVLATSGCTGGTSVRVKLSRY